MLTPPSARDINRFLDQAIRLAAGSVADGGGPFGALVVTADGRVHEGVNRVTRDNDPTAHAEIRALRAAAQKIGNYRLTGATLCVTVEPCAMCVGAMVHARIGALVYGAAEPKTGAVRSTMKLIDDPSWNHRIVVVAGVMADECRELIQEFFRERRKGKNE